MSDTADVIRVLSESLIGRSERDPPSTERFGEWLEEQVTGASYLSRDWAPRNWSSYLLGDAGQHPGLLELSEEQRREFMFALRPAHALHRVSVVRTEAILAGLADGDARRMHDGLWTYGRLNLAGRLNSSSGTDYSVGIFDYLEETAVADDELADEGVPHSAPPSRRGYRFAVVATNLARALRYGHDRDAARENAVKFAAGKSTKKFEALITEYLVAVLDADADVMRQHLGEIARTWTSTPWSRTWHDPLHKVLSLKLHGLAVLGERAAPGVSDVAAGTNAWSAEFATLIRTHRAAGAVPRPVVDLPGVTNSLTVILRPRPFHDYAGGGA